MVGASCCVLAVRKDFLDENLDLVRKIVKVHIRATVFILENHAEAAQIAKKWTGQNETGINRAMSNIEFLYSPDPQDVKDWLII